jgi:ATP/maltotriose-dependent transcriptional regulator MalT
MTCVIRCRCGTHVIVNTIKTHCRATDRELGVADRRSAVPGRATPTC